MSSDVSTDRSGVATAGEVPAGGENRLLVEVDQALADGLALLRWWQQREAAQDYAERFQLVRSFNQPLTSFGFFDQVYISGRPLPVMGVVEEMLYDQAKQVPRERLRDEFREFILHYFLRVSAFDEPGAYADPGRPLPASYRPGISWCQWEDARLRGFGYSQLYYKRAGSGTIGRFPPMQQSVIADLRDIGPTYEWLLCKVRLFNFNLSFRPFGPESLTLVLPLQEQTYVVLSRDFITHQDDPAPGVLGEYGFGYVLIRYAEEKGVLAYGPGHFKAGFQLINFRVLEDGEVRVRMVFVVNRPDRILDIPLDPIGWGLRVADYFSFGFASRWLAPAKRVLDVLPLRVNGFDPITSYIVLANVLTAGQAADDLCISRAQLEKDFLTQHFAQHYEMIVGSLRTWREVANWLDEQAIPEVIKMGVCS